MPWELVSWELGIDAIMFLLDSLMISGISWTLRTVVTAAEAEMNDDTALREQLLAAEMQREMGEITDEDFAEIERDLLARIREIKERREGGAGPLAFGEGEPIETTDDSRFQIEATVSGDFHQPENAPHTTIIDTEPVHRGLVGTRSGSTLSVLDIEPVHAETLNQPPRPLRGTTRRRKTSVPRRRRAAASSRAAMPRPRRRAPSTDKRKKAGKIRKS
jgi:hypothetical protein